MLFVSITVIGLQNRFNKIFTASKTISAEIDLHIQSDNKYLSSAYDEATAQIHITVTKISGSKRVIVWEKDFKNMQLKNYSNNSNTETLMIPNLTQLKEKLEEPIQLPITVTEVFCNLRTKRLLIRQQRKVILL